MAAMASQKHGVTPGQQYSLFLHLLLLAIMIFGLPNFLHKKIESEPMAISVDILPIAPVSNVKPVEEVKPKEIQKPVAEKTTDRKAHVETNKAQPKPEPKPEPVKKDEPKKVEPKPADAPEKMTAKDFLKKPEKKQEKPKEKQDDLKSILDSVEKSAKTEESKRPTQAQPQPQHEAKSDNYNAHMPLSMSEMDAIGQQVARCWSPDAGAKDAANLAVLLHITVNPDGSLIKVELAKDNMRYNSDSYFRAAADRAIRAVKECSPLKNLPADKYGGSNGWGDMEFNFDPSKFS